MQRDIDRIVERRISRRSFLTATTAGGAALLTGGVGSLVHAVPNVARGRDEPWIEATISELDRLMAKGRLTSRELTGAYLRRIEELNPLLGAVIEVNPDAIAIARQRD